MILQGRNKVSVYWILPANTYFIPTITIQLRRRYLQIFAIF